MDGWMDGWTEKGRDLCLYLVGLFILFIPALREHVSSAVSVIFLPGP